MPDRTRSGQQTGFNALHPAPAILAVDSGEDMRDLYRELFGPMGYRVTAQDCSDADCGIMARQRPDIILLGCFLGCEHTSWDLLRALDFDPDLWAVPVIVCPSMGLLSAAQTTWLRTAGVQVLPRPFTMSGLIASVTDAARAARWGDTEWRGRQRAVLDPLIPKVAGRLKRQ